MNAPQTAARSATPVQSRLDRRLVAYATAATAAGIGLLAAPNTTNAEVVYTPANVAVKIVGGTLALDLDNDGNPDFVVELITCARSNCLVVNPWIEGNGIKGFNGRASAASYGAAIGPQGRFLTQFRRGTSWSRSYVGFMVNAGAYGSGSWSGGAWANSTNRYMGLKFLIAGKVHYGWARLSVRVMRNKLRLTGYAYETIPNHRILAGQTSGLSSSTLVPADRLTPAPGPASLGLLARGSDALAIWHREESDEVTNAR
jgi:hypothetical protein